MTEQRLQLVDMFGSIPAGRPSGAALREAIERLAAGGGVVVILDLSGVEDVTPSVADELFGKLPLSLPEERLRFENLSEHLAEVAERALRVRRAREPA